MTTLNNEWYCQYLMRQHRTEATSASLFALWWLAVKLISSNINIIMNLYLQWVIIWFQYIARYDEFLVSFSQIYCVEISVTNFITRAEGNQISRLAPFLIPCLPLCSCQRQKKDNYKIFCNKVICFRSETFTLLA